MVRPRPDDGSSGNGQASHLHVATTRPKPAREAAPLGAHQLQRLFDRAPSTFVADLDGNLLYANDAFWALFESLGSSDAENWVLSVSNDLARAAEREGGLEAEYAVAAGDRQRSLFARFWRLGPMNGAESAVAGTLHAESKTFGSAAQLDKARARFEDIARLTSDWVWEVDDAFRFVFASARVAELIGLPARLLLGHSLFDCGSFEGFEEANRTQHPKPGSRVPFSDIRYRVLDSDGVGRLFRLSGVPIFEERTGRFSGYRGTATDVTAQTEAEARISEAQTRLIHAVETMPQGFALYDALDQLVLCNSQYESFLAPNAATLSPGASFETLIREAATRGMFDREELSVEQFVVQQLVRHKMAARDQEIRLADGRWVLVTSEVTEDGGIIEVWNEITKMKKREDALRAAEEESRQARELSELANRVKTQFLANMSHELRTPLNAIIGFSEIIKSEMFGALGNARYNEYAQDIFNSGTHLLGVINDILEFAKAEAGKMELIEEDVDLRGVVEACFRLLQPRAADAEVTIRHDIPANLPAIHADQTKMRQIILNLVSNGIKFTPSGGRVQVSASASSEEGYVVKVVDTGIGISEEDLPKVMSAFGQVDSALSRKYDGTGLGLPLSISMVELHGGKLRLESTVGVGTSVTMSFPSARIVTQ